MKRKNHIKALEIAKSHGLPEPETMKCEGYHCSRCGEPDKCLIIGKCLRADNRKAYFEKYGRTPNEGVFQSLSNEQSSSVEAKEKAND
jgi:hypothetical protein